MNVYIVTILILLFYFVLAWLAGTLLRLQGASLWGLRAALIFIGVIAAGLFLWFHHRIKRGKGTTLSENATVAEQVRILLRQAEQKLVMGKQGSLRSLPIVFILGEPNSAKTYSIVNSGLEPELIAGHVFRDNDIVPTSVINVWFARKTIFIEAGGKLAADPQLWGQILRQTRPQRISAAVGKGLQAPRAALVCLDCERLASSQAAVQNLANRLKEMARSLGAAFPVFVLFTKLDRIPHFAEFVGNLTTEEAAQVLGTTLPRMTGQGVFAEEESKRLAKAFDQIIYSLAEKRLDYLGRETLVEKADGIYEFPREFRKSRNQVVQILVDLTRPTQLSANPFLRGFYFSGVRAIVINEAVSLPSTVQAAAAMPGSGATRMFRYVEGVPESVQSAPQRAVQSRKVPEWTFLPHLFTEIVLADRVAFSASHQSSRVDRLRRWLLASASVILLAFAIALLVSFFNNRGLENQVTRDAQHLNAIAPGASIETPGVDQLRQLDDLRASVATLAQYQFEGPPLGYRFGLYAGDRVYPSAYGVYFQNFRRLLLASTQSRMTAILRQPPSTTTSDDFQQIYFTLKAYLITTRNHEHADWNSLVQVLLDNSPAYKNADADAKELIRRQFAFYAENLLRANPFSPDADTPAVDRARAYLKQFDALRAVYQAMVDDAGRGRKPVNFNRQFPQSASYVVDSYEVPAAFTKDGFAVMQKSLQNPEKFRGEEWVLGAPTTLNISGSSLRDALAKMYADDFLRVWRTYLKSAHVVGFGNLKDASTKLSRLVANDSPLLQLFWLAKDNTDVNLPDLQNPLQAVQSIARESTPEKLVGSGNQEYMGTLSGLQNSIQTVVNTPNGLTDPAMLSGVQGAASNASGTVKKIAQTFTIDDQAGGDKDKVDKNVARLLEEPIDYVNDAAKRAGGAPAESICAIVSPVLSKRPFNSRSGQVAALQEVQDMFRPQQGTLWTAVQARFGTMIQRQGSSWVNIGSAPQSQNFLNFLNHAQQFTDALYPNGAPTVHLAYTLRAVPSLGIIRPNLVIDGVTLPESGKTQQFVWQGGESSIVFGITSGGVSGGNTTYNGPWALFDFFGSATKWSGNNPATLDYSVHSTLQLGDRPLGNDQKTYVEFELSTSGAQIFRKEFLSGLHCSAR